MANLLVMKNIFLKVKVNEATYFLILVFLFTGHIKNILLIFLIIVVHELGHIFFLKLFGYEIFMVEILPFGGITKTDKMINTPINYDLVIYFGGIFFQILLNIFFLFLTQKQVIYLSTFKMFKNYNLAIMIFNILPIRPLDGGEILRLLLEKRLTFIRAQRASNILSIFFLGCFLVINIKFNLNNYVIISFLFFKIYNLIKNEKFLQNKFWLERFMYSFSYSKISNEKKEDLKLLKKETYHFFYKGNRYISEKELLQQKFDRKYYF